MILLPAGSSQAQARWKHNKIQMGCHHRYLLLGHSFHITLRCNSRQFLIAKGLRRDVLLAVLAKAKQKVACKVYAVCLMANHDIKQILK